MFYISFFHANVFKISPVPETKYWFIFGLKKGFRVKSRSNKNSKVCMQRSKINKIALEADAFTHRLRYALPPFADWPLERHRSAQATIIYDRGLSRDITDFNSNKLEEIRFLLFMVRNGLLSGLNKGRDMLDSEKIAIYQEEQVTPVHRHTLKA